eukprot:1844376-Pleurochrysis_carterae.AAC.1
MHALLKLDCRFSLQWLIPSLALDRAWDVPFVAVPFQFLRIGMMSRMVGDANEPPSPTPREG